MLPTIAASSDFTIAALSGFIVVELLGHKGPPTIMPELIPQLGAIGWN
jgi:hypothetical protein